MMGVPNRIYKMNGSTIYHVHLIGENTHHYFGSIAAIFDEFSPEQIGVSKSRLWSYKITETHPYRNKKCTIRRGTILRKKNCK